MVRFSSRTDVGELNTIARAEQRLRANGVALASINDSNPTTHGLAPRTLPGPYVADPRGPIALRRALAKLANSRRSDGTATDPDDIYALSSTSQAYGWLIKLLCDPGDGILAPTPGYPLIASLARLEAVETLPYALRYDGSWCIDVDGIRRALEGPVGEHIHALALINPNNPTGSYIKPAEREAIVDICAKYGIALIADEVFFDYALEPFAGNRRIEGESRVLTFALDGFSKMLAAPHAKLGWIQVSGPRADVEEAKRRLDVIADDYLPMSDIIAQQVPTLLDQASAQTERVRARVLGNVRSLHSMLQEDSNGVVSLLRCEGGWNVLLRVPQMLDENALILNLIERYQLTGQPGYFFDMPTPGYLVVSLLPEPPVFAARIRAVLNVVGEMLGTD